MASEIRVNSLTNRSGLSTVSITDAGLNAVGIITAHNFKTGTTNVHSTGVTAADGVFTGNVSVTGNLNVSGVLTYDDVTNIDSVGIITARSGIHITGTDEELRIYRDQGDRSWFGGLRYTGSLFKLRLPAADHFTVDDSSNNERFRITSAGNIGDFIFGLIIRRQNYRLMENSNRKIRCCKLQRLILFFNDA